MIRFACPGCRTPSEAAIDQAGKKIECPYCGQRLEIPRPPREQTLMGILLPPPDDGAATPHVESVLLRELDYILDSLGQNYTGEAKNFLRELSERKEWEELDAQARREMLTRINATRLALAVQTIEVPEAIRWVQMVRDQLRHLSAAPSQNNPSGPDPFTSAIRGGLLSPLPPQAAKPPASPPAAPTTGNSTRPAAPVPVIVQRRGTQQRQEDVKESPLQLGIFVAVMCAAAALVLWGFWPSESRRYAAAPTVPARSFTPPPIIAPPTKPRIDETFPVQPLPLNGTVERSHLGEPVAPLRVVTRDQGQHYFVKVCNWTKGELIATMFVHAGSTAEAKMPLGQFQIKYATGTTWYGPDHCFGPQTAYHKADSRFHFQQVGREMRGFTIELFLQPNGNLRTNAIRREEF
jgi:DNA-directed RNA polymerase subunit RPC12/RpoP